MKKALRCGSCTKARRSTVKCRDCGRQVCVHYAGSIARDLVTGKALECTCSGCGIRAAQVQIKSFPFR